MCRPKIILSMTARKDTFEAYATVQCVEGVEPNGGNAQMCRK